MALTGKYRPRDLFGDQCHHYFGHPDFEPRSGPCHHRVRVVIFIVTDVTTISIPRHQIVCQWQRCWWTLPAWIKNKTFFQTYNILCVFSFVLAVFVYMNSSVKTFVKLTLSLLHGMSLIQPWCVSVSASIVSNHPFPTLRMAAGMRSVMVTELCLFLKSVVWLSRGLRVCQW